MSRATVFEWGPPPLPDLLAAQLAESSSEPSDAAGCAADIVAGAQASSSLFLDLGAYAFLGGDIDGALAAWRHALTSADAPVVTRARLNIGLLYEHLGLHASAISVLGAEPCAEVTPDTIHASTALARCQCAHGRSDEAMETLARLAQSLMADHDDPTGLGEALIALGEVALAAGRPDRAERAWRAAAAAPDVAIRHTATGNLVGLLRELGHDDEALALLESAHGSERSSRGRHSPELFAQAVERAGLLLELGRGAEAREVVASLAAAGLGVPDRFRLVEIRLRVGLVNEAIDELEHVLASQDRDARQRALFTLGQIYRHHAMPESADAMYRRVLAEGDGYWARRAAALVGTTEAQPVPEPAAATPQVVPGDASPTRSLVVDAAPSDAGPGSVSADVLVSRADAMVATVPEVMPEAGAVSAGTEVAAADEAAGADTDVVAEPATTAVVVGNDGPVLVEGVTMPETERSVPVDAGPPTERVVGVADQVEVEALAPASDSVGDGIDHEVRASAPVISGGRGAFTGATSTPAAEASPHGHRFDIPRSPRRNGSTEPKVRNGHGSGGRRTSIDAGSQAEVEPPARRGAESEAREPIVVLLSSFDDNPYAALAPEAFEGDVAPSMRNPYAELAPTYDDGVAEPRDEWVTLFDIEQGSIDEPSLSAEADDRGVGRTTGIFSRSIGA